MVLFWDQTNRGHPSSVSPFHSTHSVLQTIFLVQCSKHCHLSLSPEVPPWSKHPHTLGLLYWNGSRLVFLVLLSASLKILPSKQCIFKSMYLKPSWWLFISNRTHSLSLLMFPHHLMSICHDLPSLYYFYWWASSVFHWHPASVYQLFRLHEIGMHPRSDQIFHIIIYLTAQT